MTFGIFTGPGRPWTLLHVRGIPIRVQRFLAYLLAFFLGLTLVTQGLGPMLGASVVIGMVLMSVTLHELGHALMAQRFGVDVIDITLWPLGGVAMLREMPEDAKIEGLVAVAGPAVNLVLAAGAALLLLVSGLPVAVSPAGPPTLWGSLLHTALLVNLVMGVFNLLPAFPMDGGKLLRSALATRTSWLQATEISANVGRVLAWVMIFSFWFSPILPFLGVFLLFAGGRERLAVRLRHAGPAGLGGMAFAGGNMAELMRRMAEAAQAQQGMGGEPEDAFAEAHPGTTGSGPGPRTVDVEAEPHGAARPAGAPPPQQGGGFSDEDVRRLESFRGRLPRDRD